MTIEQYWTSLLKRWKVIVFCFLAIGLGAYVGSRLITPTYQSTALIQVTIRSASLQADINSLLASDQLVQTEALLAISDPVLREVVSHYPGLSIDQLTKNVHVVVKPNTQLFEIDVEDPRPQRAAALANDIATTLIKQQTGLAQQDRGQLQQQILQELKQTQHQIDGVTGQIAAIKNKNENAQTDALDAKLYDLQEHYRELQSLLTDLELAQSQGGVLHIVQPAQAATKPAQPHILINTGIGLLAGLLCGLLLVMLLEQLDTRVRTEEALAKVVDWPVLTTIWYQNPMPRRGKKQGEGLVNPTEHNPNVESYRILRANLGFSVINKPIRSVAVISAIPHEGKSTIAANLGIFMAKAGKKTLLIDADLRRPTLSKKFQLPADTLGLSNAVTDCYQHQLSASTAPEGTLSAETFSLSPYMHATDTPGLYIIPSGSLPPNPSELLDSKAMAYFYKALAKYDMEMIIFDTPPLLGLSDASILIPKVDGVVVVIDITRANKKYLKWINKLLAQSGGHLLGCIVNKQYRGRKEHGYSYYYYAEKEAMQQQKEAIAARGATRHAQRPAEPAFVLGKSQVVEAIQGGGMIADQATQVFHQQYAAAPSSAASFQAAPAFPAQAVATATMPRPPASAQAAPAFPSQAVATAVAIKNREAANWQQQGLLANYQKGFLPTHDGLSLYYQIMGHGPRTILIPAASWLAADFEPLAQEYTLIFYDQRGRGHSDMVTDASLIGIQQDVRDLEVVRHHFGLETVSLIGWSYLGGMASLYAKEHPDRVERLLLIGPMSLRSYNYEDPRILDLDARVDQAALQRVEAMREAGLDKSDPGTYYREFARATRLPKQMGNPAALANMRSNPWASANEWPDSLLIFSERFFSSLKEWDWGPRLASLKTPTLIMHGLEDLIPLASSIEWAATLPHARLFTMENVGHYPWLENPNLFFTAVAQFLAGQWPQGSQRFR